MTLAVALGWINNGWRLSIYAKQKSNGLGIDVDGLYGFQCMDFVVAYSRFLGATFASGNAITLWTKPQAGWTQVASPQPGDVFVKDYFSNGINYGHTGCVQEVSPLGVYSVDQNWFYPSLTIGSPPARVFHPSGSVKGFLRFGGFMSTDSVSYQEAQVMYLGWVPGQDVNLEFCKKMIGMKLPDALHMLQNDSSITGYRQSLLVPPDFEQLSEAVYRKKVK